jgi:hypothetical protein
MRARQLEAIWREGLPLEAYTRAEGTGLLFPAETESSVLSTESRVLLLSHRLSVGVFS